MAPEHRPTPPRSPTVLIALSASASSMPSALHACALAYSVSSLVGRTSTFHAASSAFPAASPWAPRPARPSRTPWSVTRVRLW